MRSQCLAALALVVISLLLPLSAGAQYYSTDYGTTAQSGSAVTTQETVRTASTVVSNLISSRIRGALSGRGTGVRRSAGGATVESQSGLSGGGRGLMWGLWGSYSRNESENDLPSTAFESDLDSFFGGIDVALKDNVILGVAVGYEHNDIETQFNAGEQDIDGYTIVPYLGIIVSRDHFSVGGNLSGGYSSLDISQFRTFNGARISSTLDSERWFLAGNVNATRPFGNWLFTGHGGLLWAEDEQDAFIESDGSAVAARATQLGQVQLGGEVAYALDAWEPYASATYACDFEREETVVSAGQAQPANDRDDVLFGVGLRYFGDHGISGSLEFNAVTGREDFESYSGTASIRVEF